MARGAKARVFMNGRSQHVTIPAEYRFGTDEVYVAKDLHTGVVTLSERPLRSTMAEIFAKFDEVGAADFVVERDLSLPVDREIL